MAGSLRNRLLVATPLLNDPNFDRTVILLLEHSEDGAFGVVLNRSTGAPAEDVVDGFGRYVASPGHVHRGGPVSPSSVIALARLVNEDEPSTDGLTPLFGDVVAVDLDRGPNHYIGDITDLRMFSGYAGWGPLQLEHELAEDAWFTVDATPDDVFEPDPEGMWRAVLARQPSTLAMYSQFPSDPTAN